eukprot:jgi/Botrbrau1/8939/Bobra.0148s0052.1
MRVTDRYCHMHVDYRSSTVACLDACVQCRSPPGTCTAGSKPTCICTPWHMDVGNYNLS